MFYNLILVWRRQDLIYSKEDYKNNFVTKIQFAYIYITFWTFGKTSLARVFVVREKAFVHLKVPQENQVLKQGHQ